MKVGWSRRTVYVCLLWSHELWTVTRLKNLVSYEKLLLWGRIKEIDEAIEHQGNNFAFIYHGVKRRRSKRVCVSVELEERPRRCRYSLLQNLQVRSYMSQVMRFLCANATHQPTTKCAYSSGDSLSNTKIAQSNPFSFEEESVLALCWHKFLNLCETAPYNSDIHLEIQTMRPGIWGVVSDTNRFWFLV